MIRIQNENTATAMTKATILVVYPTTNNEAAKNSIDNTNGFLLLNLLTIQPEIGKPIREAIGMTKSKFPKSASLKLKIALMVGMREAQEEKQNPERKKQVLSAIRCLTFSCINHNQGENAKMLQFEEIRKAFSFL